MKKIIVRIKGGLGNQLFHYAFAKRLAIFNNCPLVIDDQTCFKKYEYLYNRKYNLNNFLIEDITANKKERLEPLEKLRRNLLLYYSELKSFDNKSIYNSKYLEFDQRFLSLKINKTIILDGNWQSEKYFKDVEGEIRKNLEFKNIDKLKKNKYYFEIIKNNSVGLHLRSHGYKEPSKDSIFNANKQYYKNAIDLINSQIANPHFYIFSDGRTNINDFVDLSNLNFTIVTSNKSLDSPINDFFLLSNCKFFINAASTFSWWAAWLSKNKNKIIISPNVVQTEINKTSAWGFEGLIPKEWIVI